MRHPIICRNCLMVGGWPRTSTIWVGDLTVRCRVNLFVVVRVLAGLVSSIFDSISCCLFCLAKL